MEFTNENQDTDFEEQDDENENQEIESQTNSSIDRTITIDYYKKHIQTIYNRVNKINEKLHHNRKIQLQFSMLLNKTVENQFGAILDEPTIQKQTVPPLPPIHKESRTEIIRLIHSGTPSEVSSYFQKSNVIPLLLFSDTSVFDQRLKESLMRASPDIQVSFFNSIFQQIKKCGEFIDRMMPLLSKYSTDSLLHSQIFSTNSTFSDFYLHFYVTFINSISALISMCTIRIVYTTNDFTSLIYPTEKYFNVINVTNSVCGQLLKKKSVRLNSPQKNPLFEIVSEGPLFEDFTNILSIRFNFSSTVSKSPAGAVIVLSKEKIANPIETHLSLIVDYFSPLLKLIRSLLIHTLPRHFAGLSRSVSLLRTEGCNIESYQKTVASVCGASSCSILLTKSNNFFNDVKCICEEEGQKSLIMNAVQSGEKVFTCLNPRKSSQFNKKVDDEPRLPKISSMLVSPVIGTDFVFALYNSSHSSDFTPVQKSIALSVSQSLRPLLTQAEKRREIEREADEGGLKQGEFERAIQTVGQMVESCIEGRLFEYVHNLLSSSENSLNCYLFVKLTADEVIRFPGGDLVEVSDNLKVSDFFFETDQFDLNIDVAGDTSVCRILVASSSSCTSIITTNSAGGFARTGSSFIKCVSSLLLMLAPLVFLEGSLSQCKESHQLLRDSIRLSSESFSRLINARVDLLIFDRPLESDAEVEGAPLVVSIETKKGIEGALAAYDSSREVRAASVSYAEWLTSALGNRIQAKSDKQTTELVSLFVSIGTLDAFKCSEKEFAVWADSVIQLLPHSNLNGLLFIKKLIIDSTFSEWFSGYRFVILLLLVFLRGIEKKWECKSDTKTVKVLKKCHLEKCSAPLAAVFGSGFGISDRLTEKDATFLSGQMSAMASSFTMRDASLVVSHVRSISMRGFKKCDSNVKWIGRASLWLSRAHWFESGLDASKSLLQEFGEQNAKSELFVAERVLLPILSFLSVKNENIAKLSSNVRESILMSRKMLN